MTGTSFLLVDCFFILTDVQIGSASIQPPISLHKVYVRGHLFLACFDAVRLLPIRAPTRSCHDAFRMHRVIHPGPAICHHQVSYQALTRRMNIDYGVFSWFKGFLFSYIGDWHAFGDVTALLSPHDAHSRGLPHISVLSVEGIRVWTAIRSFLIQGRDSRVSCFLHFINR